MPAVEAAQAYGVRVHLWGIEPPYGRNQAERLVWESDVSVMLGRDLFAPYVELLPPPPPRTPVEEPAAVAVPVPTPLVLAGLRRPPRPAAAPGPDVRAVHEIGEHVAGKWLVTRGRDNLADLLPGPMLPTVIDRDLLVAAEEELGRSLRPWHDARTALREGFWERLHREFGLRV